MRLAVCTLSAVLLSGCSWMGFGGNQAGYAGAGGCGAGGVVYNAQYGQYATAPTCGGGYGVATGYGAGFGPGAGFGSGAYGSAGYSAGAGAYGVAPAGLRGAQGAYGQAGYGNGGVFGAGSSVNGAGSYGVANSAAGAYGSSYGAGAYGASTSVAGGGVNGAGQVISGSAPYAAATGGQYINGQWVSGAAGQYASNGYGATYGGGSVTTVQGSPIYVPQPYPAYYPVGVATGGGYAYGGGMRGGFAALPFGIEASVGTEIGIGGGVIPAKPGGPALGSATRSVSPLPAVSYSDAFDNAVNYELAATYDVSPSTTLIGRLGYSKANGNRVPFGTVSDTGCGCVDEPYYGQLGNLEQWTLEGGVRQYMGGWNSPTTGLRPYVAATAGFAHNNNVNLVQDSAVIINPPETQRYIDAGWTPTASAVVGAEMQVGARSALGVEAGVRWRDNLNTNLESGDRWSVPIKLRGRVSF